MDWGLPADDIYAYSAETFFYLWTATSPSGDSATSEIEWSPLEVR